MSRRRKVDDAVVVAEFGRELAALVDRYDAPGREDRMSYHLDGRSDDLRHRREQRKPRAVRK